MAEICFEAPEINMASDIVIDARVSIVTVSKLVDVRVTGSCKCPDGSSGLGIKSFASKPTVSSGSTKKDFFGSFGSSSKPTNSGSSGTASNTSYSSSKPSGQSFAKTEPAKVTPIVATPERRPSSPEIVMEIMDDAAIVQSAAPQDSEAEDSFSESFANPDKFDASMSSAADVSPILASDRQRLVKITGKLTSEWKNKNILGEFQFDREDKFGRPIYKRTQLTNTGKTVYLYHIHQSKKWRVGPESTSSTCWLFVTSKVNKPQLINQDVDVKGRHWYEHSGGNWLPVKDMRVEVL